MAYRGLQSPIGRFLDLVQYPLKCWNSLNSSGFLTFFWVIVLWESNIRTYLRKNIDAHFCIPLSRHLWTLYGPCAFLTGGFLLKISSDGSLLCERTTWGIWIALAVVSSLFWVEICLPIIYALEVLVLSPVSPWANLCPFLCKLFEYFKTKLWTCLNFLKHLHWDIIHISYCSPI